MATKMGRYGARLFFYEDGTVQVYETVKSPTQARYVIDKHTSGKEKMRWVSPGDDRALVEAIRLAGHGDL